MTLLETFNNYLDSVYMEPERKGVEKGKEIGVFRSTHQALLYSLYNFDEKTKAERAGISYVFLRKLRCTDRFKEHVYHRRLNFVEECFFMYIERGHFYKYVPTPATVNKNIKIAVNAETAFDDAALYDNDTKLMITDWLIGAVEEIGWLDDSQKMKRVFDFLIKWNEPELNKKLYVTLVKVYSEEIRNLLNRKDMTEENRKNAMKYTKLIFEFSATL